VIAADSSVLIAAFAGWHEAHDVARDALRERPRLIAHCALETYSVLTRLPHPHRAPGQLVVEFLRDEFHDRPLVPSQELAQALLPTLHDAEVYGGAVYDGLVALTAAEHGARLLTLDVRAEGVYRRCGVEFTLMRRSHASD
jgi:predicted nucleic acid-binding protein